LAAVALAAAACDGIDENGSNQAQPPAPVPATVAKIEALLALIPREFETVLYDNNEYIRRDADLNRIYSESASAPEDTATILERIDKVAKGAGEEYMLAVMHVFLGSDALGTLLAVPLVSMDQQRYKGFDFWHKINAFADGQDFSLSYPDESTAVFAIGHPPIGMSSMIARTSLDLYAGSTRSFLSGPGIDGLPQALSLGFAWCTPARVRGFRHIP
jgi:hypothetical protein